MTGKPGGAGKRDRSPRREGEATHEEQTAPAWVLSAAEWRLLVITFVGGLGPIIAAACVIGGAIVIARQVRSGGLRIWGLDAVIGIVVGVVLLLSTRYIRQAFKHSDRARRVVRVVVWIIFTVYIVAYGLTLLIWIGVAAGVK